MLKLKVRLLFRVAGTFESCNNGDYLYPLCSGLEMWEERICSVVDSVSPEQACNVQKKYTL